MLLQKARKRRSPRFSWKLKSDKENVVQENYRVVAAADPGFAAVLFGERG